MGKYQETDTFRSETLLPQTSGSTEITEDDFLDMNNRAVDRRLGDDPGSD
jgi:hypothetical protein